MTRTAMTKEKKAMAARGPTKAKALIVGLLAAGMMATGLVAALPAQAADTFTVDQAVDTQDVNIGDGDCDVSLAATGFQCTLRAAIQEANATSEPDLIRFSIPDSFGAGVKTITPTASLPPITAPVTVDGYTQPGSSPNTLTKGTNAKLMVQLTGFDAGDVGSSFTNGIEVAASNTSIKGLVINRYSANGVEVRSGVTGVKIEGNFIGTDPSGTLDRGNSVQGVRIGSGNAGTTVGGSSPNARNLISGNDGDGVTSRSANAPVLGNLIGTKKDGSTALGNARDGVLFVSAQSSAIGNGSSAGANTIAFNGGDGIKIVEDSSLGLNTANGNNILRNSIFSNAGLGIDLGFDGPAANDAGDADGGPNTLQNKPVISSAKTVSGKTTVQGSLGSTPNRGFLIEFYSNPSGGEGKKFVGDKVVSTNASGNVSFTFSPANAVTAGQTVTATASGDRNGPGGTSEFSAPKKVTAS